MKKVLLLLLGRYKYFFAIFSSLLVFVSIAYAYNFASIGMSEFLVLIVAWVFFLTIIWNVSYVYAPSINEDSNIYDVISRLGLIIISFLILIYGIVSICFSLY
jgi:hypothetical protein